MGASGYAVIRLRVEGVQLRATPSPDEGVEYRQIFACRIGPERREQGSVVPPAGLEPALPAPEADALSG